MGKGFNGFPGNMQGLLKQAQVMQDKLRKTQEEAKKIIVDSSAGGGAVKVVVSGDCRIVSLEISPDLMAAGDIAMLQELVMLACNEALTKAQDQVQAEIGKVTGGMNIPGMF